MKVKKKSSIRILMKNGKCAIWKKHEWDDYSYDGNFFVVKKNEKWIAFYNMSKVISIIIA